MCGSVSTRPIQIFHRKDDHAKIIKNLRDLASVDGAMHQPHYLPWCGLLEKFDRADVFVFVDHVQFARKGWQNRNYIKTAHGRLLLTTPVLQRARSETIDTKTIDTAKPWRIRHHRSILQAYAAAPFLADYRSVLDEIYRHDWLNLCDLNIAVTVQLAELMGITTPWLRSSDLGTIRSAKTEMLVEICHRIGVTTYLSGDGASYFEESRFDEVGIELRRQRFTHPYYQQQHPAHGFLPNLAAFDLLLNTGPEALALLRSANIAQRLHT